MYPRHNNAETPCAITVANAAPAVLSENPTINQISNIRFKMEENIRKYRGVLLSPMPLKIPAATLYDMLAIIPASMILV